MKRLTLIGLLVVIAVAWLWRHREHVKIARFDSDFRQTLAGTWSSELDNMRLTNVVMPDGSFTSRLMFIHPGHTNTYQERGTWLVSDGKMIETVTIDTNPTARTPRSHVAQIIHADAHEFALHWQGSPDEWVWKKIIQ